MASLASGGGGVEVVKGLEVMEVLEVVMTGDGKRFGVTIQKG